MPPPVDSNRTALEAGQRWIFLVTFLNYALSHWTRKSYTNVKVQLQEAGVDALTLTAMDSGFMFTYAGGSFITGQLGDRFSPVRIIACGLLGSTVCLFSMIFGVSPWVTSSSALVGMWFLGTQLIHGAFQATGGPVNTAIMGNWFPAKGRGLVFGLWTCHQYVGDILAAFFSAWVLSIDLNWRYVILVPAVVNGLWSIVNFLFVPATPEQCGIETERGRKAAAAAASGETAGAIGFLEAFALPNVMSYAIAFGFFKLVNYAMFFQLPVILNSHFDSSTANIISSLYSIGMMPGGVVCGWVSDLYGGRRACVIATFMAILVPLLYLFAMYMGQMHVGLLLSLLCLMGCLVGGPNNIITSAVAADLADDPSIGGNSKALGTVTGIINGSGSVTAAIGQLAIPVLLAQGQAAEVGYRYVWFFLIGCTIVGTALMYPKIAKELADVGGDARGDPRETELLNRGGSNFYQSVRQ
jgi:sugar phosphate permease